MEHRISAGWLANPNCSSNYFPHILWSFPCSLHDRAGPPPLRMISKFWPRSPLTFKHMSLPSHAPLKYRCPHYCYVGLPPATLVAFHQREDEPRYWSLRRPPHTLKAWKALAKMASSVLGCISKYSVTSSWTACSTTFRTSGFPSRVCSHPALM